MALASTDTDANSGPRLDFVRNPGEAGADADYLSAILHRGYNDATELTTFAEWNAQIVDASNGSEDGRFYITTMVAGTASTNRMDFTPSETVFNEGSVDLDFRVEGNLSQGLIFVDGSMDNVSIVGSEKNATVAATAAATQFLQGGSSVFRIVGHNSEGSAQIIHASSTTDSVQPSLNFSKSGNAAIGSNTIVADDENIGMIVWTADDGTNLLTPAASIECEIDGTPGENDMPARIVFSTTADGAASATERARISRNGAFKATLGGESYLSDDGYYHEFTNNGNYGMYIMNTDTGFTNAGVSVGCLKSANSNYTIAHYYSGDGSSDRFSDREFNLRGDGEAYADASWNASGADYSEYFEWKDGNSSSEDRVGISVKLDGNKIVASADSDDATNIIGVISGSPVVVGDSAWNKWQLKHLKDDFGRYIWEEYTNTTWTQTVDAEGEALKEPINHQYATDRIPSGITAPDDATILTKDNDGNMLTRRKANPDWNKDTVYIPREDRKEWDTVGMMGKLRMKKGQKTGTNWIKMRDISDSVEEWLVR